ncbi:MAG: hypothetical protein AB2A00_02350 [Myxococcota bacterium]
MRQKFWLLGVFSTLFLVGSMFACTDTSNSSDTDPECAAGKDCICDGENCNISCGGDSKSDCAFKCKGGATCMFTCEGGGCSVECSGDSSCTVNCAGGTCANTCTDAKSCHVNCSGNGCGLNCGSGAEMCMIEECTSTCALACNGASGCSNSCDVAAGCTTSN